MHPAPGRLHQGCAKFACQLKRLDVIETISINVDLTGKEDIL